MDARWVEYLSLDELSPAPVNSKRHSQRDIEKSIERFGYTAAIELDERTQKIAAGHGRLEALQVMRDGGAEPPEGIAPDWKVPVQRGWASKNDAEAIAYGIAANQLTILGGFDESELLDSINALDDLDGVGFTLDDINEMAARISQLPKTPMTDPDHVPEPPKTPITKLGDVWELGTHRVICGDSTDVSMLDRLMGDEKADMVFTDPPYGVDYDGGVMTKREKLLGDSSTSLYEPTCVTAYMYSEADAPLYLWHAGVKGISAAAAAAAAAAGYEIRAEIIWNKNQAQFGALSAQYKQKHEPCFYCFKRGASARWAGPTNETTVWDVDRATKNEWHPTQKPVALAERALGNHDCAVVLDLFGGSGSTLIAAHGLGKHARLVELDPQYVDTICKRFQLHTGIKPILESTGEPCDFTTEQSRKAVTASG